jgi:hypothetical protein
MAPVEMRRTFWAGPVTQTPPARYDYARSSNCHPSRYGFLVARTTGVIHNSFGGVTTSSTFAR